MSYPLIHGIAVVPKQGGDPVAEWFPTEAQRDEFFAWYQQHGRICAKTSKVDAAAVARAEKLAADKAHQRALELAHAGRPDISNSTRYDAPAYGVGGLDLGGLDLGLALGLCF